MDFTRFVRLVLLTVVLTLPPASGVVAQDGRARITEARRTIETYPFSEPNPVPVLTSDERLYPYYTFEGYAQDREPREWTVVHLENDWIEVWVLPEVGGKVWGARVKASGNEFIYRNEVMKFRNIALRGPWTSGGIEFNFGVVGHTPSTATAVDYVTRENDDGSVSVVVGTMDLPSRTHWRVEIRLPADAAYFETKALWNNPTVLEQPYYNWMTAAAFARDDLRMTIPGTAYLEHPGGFQTWPNDDAGRDLSVYDQNRFGGNKSFHVVGRFDDFFGGYFESADYGFGHWSPYEQMPGQKLWLWALSRAGGIWEDLLTDTDGQYVEYQAGRLLVQYTPTGEVNPISQVGFDAGRTDQWSEGWFPLEGLGGLSDASSEGAIHVERAGDDVRIRVQAFRATMDTLRVRVDGEVVFEEAVSVGVLQTIERSVDGSRAGPTGRTIAAGADFVVELPRMGLAYHSDPEALALGRPFEAVPGAEASLSEVDRLVISARQLVLGQRLGEARPLFERALRAERWNREGLLGLADLEYRRGRFPQGLEYATRLLRLDAYDAAHNDVAGRLYRALGRDTDAREAYGWAARSTTFRSAAYVQLAELALERGDAVGADRYAILALDFDRRSPSALQLQALVARSQGRTDDHERYLTELLGIDPLHHFVAAERYLASRRTGADEARLRDRFRSEYAGQQLLEVVVDYERRGQRADALALAELGNRLYPDPVLRAWSAWLADDADRLAAAPDVSLAFPWRTESLRVLEWASDEAPHWGWTYLHALNLWGRDRPDEAVALLSGLGSTPDFGPFYTTRAALAGAVGGGEYAIEGDLRHAIAMAPDTRVLHISLIQHLQQARLWDDAIQATAEARERFPDDFNLALLHVQSLNEVGRYRESVGLLESIRVLPSEHASMSHSLFAAAHTMLALNQLAASPSDAAEHLRTAMTWPERLGQGRPYEPEERAQRYLLGLALRASGDAMGAEAEARAVIDGTPEAAFDGSGTWRHDPADLLAVAALAALGRGGEASRFGVGGEGEAGRMAQTVRRWASGGDSDRDGVRAFFTTIVRDHPGLFAGVDGRILARALAQAF